jgi:exonuclease VII large subunit
MRKSHFDFRAYRELGIFRGGGGLEDLWSDWSEGELLE